MGAAPRGDRVQFQQSRRNARPSKGPTRDYVFLLHHSPLTGPCSSRLLSRCAQQRVCRPGARFLDPHYKLLEAGRLLRSPFPVRHRISPSFGIPRDTPLPRRPARFVPKRLPIMSGVPPQLVFSNEVASMDEWSRRTGIPLTTADALGTNYARARRWLLSIRSKLVQEHGWQDVTPLDSRLLFDIEYPTPYRSSRGLPRSPNMRLQIPVNASSFFSRERRVQWEMVFHSALFPGLRHTVPAIADLLHLLQCLLTGMVVLVKEEQVPGEGVYRTIRGLPPVEWVTSHEAALVDIFGSSHYRQLFRAASDNRVAFKLERA